VMRALGASPPVIAIVVPCFNEEAVLPDTVRQLTDLIDRLVATGKISPASSAVFVDDGSRDRTWSIIKREAAASPRAGGLKLSRNWGHQAAVLAGLLHTRGDAIITIDADLQDDIQVIEQMVGKFADGCDIVFGVRSARTSDTAFKRVTARFFYSFMALCGVRLVYDHADFRLMSRRAIEALRQYKEVNLFLRGLVPLIGFRTDTVQYDRKPRLAGDTKYPVRKMIRFSIEGITSFSTVPLQAITLLGFLVFLAAAGVGAWALALALFTDRTVPGWASTVVPLTLLSGVQILCLGVIGGYLAKTYNETKVRPRYFVDELITPDASARQEDGAWKNIESLVSPPS
jgi:polyisoprenyl-phosphate glycosyltransferase